MLTDLLSTVAEGGTVLVSEEDYLLARVVVNDSEMLAEISRGYTGGIPPGGWPEVDGVLLPDSEIQPGTEDDTRILLFSPPEGSEMYMERIMREGGVTEETAVRSCIALLDILRRVHDEGSRIGYLGPENVLITPEGDHMILGGARGVPDVPFSPPEAVGRIPDDPRSDVFAIGLLMFRVIAGSDDRTVQVEAWNRLSGPMLNLLENMVHPDAGRRYPNLTALSDGLRNLISTQTAAAGSRPARTREKREDRKIPGYLKWSPILLGIAAGIYFIFCSGPGGEVGPDPVPGGIDTVPVLMPDTLTSDTGSSDTDTLTVVAAPSVPPVLWISNGSGVPGKASQFREGPAQEISRVYTCSGSNRRSSVILVRRDDVFAPLAQQMRIYPLAQELSQADTSFSILPVDVTLLLGDDLTRNPIPSGAIFHSAAPVGTLYVDIANHGVDGTFDGVGAATWTRSALNGRSIMLGDEEWHIEVVDFRDGDELNDELGIIGDLDSTRFLYRTDIPQCSAAEEAIRYAILDGGSAPIPDTEVPVPDIWILLGS